MDTIQKNWLDGFVKAANALGVEDAHDVAHMIKVAGQLEHRRKNPKAYAEGYNAVVKSASLAGVGKVLKWLGIAGIGGTGAILANEGIDSVGKSIQFQRNATDQLAARKAISQDAINRGSPLKI